ncbi:ABC transporter substrate-binding protein [Bifidobacterium felsineum]|uniref:ABC transporter substrate-binding protein n=1 Tax=Bifidobacterium felsineum TaxID=2045440 RepID=A0A2M9HKD4_9BIFI|nr:extracellular solute-binding protein [Bifidobacterium felsineum]PJM77273.1 ABC transporter substrate-binding protein [Bifidobacterium felsineum]
MNNVKIMKALASVSALALCSGLSACGSKSAQDDKTLTFLDGYSQYNEDTPWAKAIRECAPDGYTVERLLQDETLSPLTTSVREDNAPDISMIDVTVLPTVVDAGMVVDLEAAGVDTTGFYDSIIDSGKVDGVQYGISYGINTLGLYYKPDILEKAGVDPASITDWDSLNAAIGKVVDAGYKGITFSGIATEEGVFQYLPWFWGAGGDLSKPDSQAAQDARDLLAGWVSKGWAPKSSTTNNQSAAWDVFLSGDYGFSEMGSWQAKSASENGYKILSIPSKNGGEGAPVPAGGEFLVLPYHKTANDAKQKAAAEFVNCMTDTNLLAVAEAAGYLASKEDVRQQQFEDEPYMKEWEDPAEHAQGRTTKLGIKYESVSSGFAQKLQSALNGK